MRKAALSPPCAYRLLCRIRRRPGRDKIIDLNLRHRTQLALLSTQVEVGNNLLIRAQTQASGDLRVVGHITGAPDCTNTLRMGSQQNPVRSAAGGQHLLLLWDFRSEE